LLHITGVSVSPTTLNVWMREGRLRYAGEWVKRPNGACKIYDAFELEQARDAIAAEDARGAALPDGLVDRDAAAALLGVTVDVALVVGLSAGFIVIWSGMVAAVLPLTLRRLGADPAVVSAPMITTLVDGTGLFMDLEIARYVLQLR
jgi:hypothetical protein